MSDKLSISLLAAVVLIIVSSTTAAGQNAGITWNQSQGTEIPLPIGAPTPVLVNAYPGMNYALMAARQSAPTQTPIGQIDIDFTDPDFEVSIDGFNPSHPLFNWGFVDGLGEFQFTFVPFPQGSPTGQSIYFQTVAQDPTAGPFNLVLSNTVGSIAAPLAPRVDAVNPRQAAFGDTITIMGDFFSGSDPTQTPVVMMNDTQLLVLSYTDESITALVVGAAHSGSVRVFSDVGASPDLSFDPAHYVAVLGNLTTEASQGLNPMDGHYTLTGQLSVPTEVDTYKVSLVAGEELFVEVFNYNAVTAEISPYDPSNWANVQLNSVVELTMPGVPISPLLSNNDGGPGFAAGIGVVQAHRFVAPFSGDFEIAVKSAFGVSHGDYLLNTWTGIGSITEAPDVIGIHPNHVAAGAPIEIYATGLDLSNPSANVVEFSGPNNTWIPAQMLSLSNGHIGAFVPANAVTGHLRVRNGAGLVSSFDADHFPSYYLLQTALATESQVYNIADSKQIIGDITITQEVDNFELSVQQGQQVSLRAFMYDAANSRLINGKIFDAAFLDPEIRVRELLSGPFHITDIHSGPGTAAEIGGMSLAPWTVPATDSYELSIQSWFYLSSGPYILDVVIQ